MGIFDGLNKLGLKNFKDSDIYEDEKKEKVETKKQEKIEITEESCLYSKEFECPVCGEKILQSAVRSGHLRALGQDKDLRPRYQAIDPYKYDVVHCNKCGYAALTRYYGPLAGPHRKLLQENISASYRPMKPVSVIVSYDDAILRYRLALANALVRRAKSSEKALICLRTAWVIRGKQEELESEKNIEDVDMMEFRKEELRQLKEDELELLQNAMDGFVKARKEEPSPIAGMNDVALDYLLAALMIQFGKKEDAYRLLQGIVTSKTAGSAQKDKARELINEIKNMK